MSRSRSRQRPSSARNASHTSIRAATVSPSRSRRGRPGRLGRLFPSAGIAAQFRVLNRLLRTTPGLRLYLGCALALWALTRALVGHGLLARPHGHALLLLAQVVALAALTLLYFGRTGQLARGRADLCELRAQLAATRPWEAEAAPPHRVLWHALAVLLRVPSLGAGPARSGVTWPPAAACALDTDADAGGEQGGEEPC